MNRVELLSDRNAAAHLERRRNRELQRQDRIFNARVRTVGIDRDAIDYQVVEKKNKEESEAKTLKEFANDLIRSDRMACMLEHRQRKDERFLAEAVDHFHHHFQQPDSRREFDLNDPERLQKQDGVRVLPGLAGEDLGSRDRLCRQREQLRDWSLQHQRELEQTKAQQKQEDHQYDQSRVALDIKALELQKMEEKVKRAEAIAFKNFNIALAAEVSARRERERREEEENNQTDIQNQLQGELLSESKERSIGLPALSQTRRVYYRGMTTQQLLHFTHCQLQQAEERMRVRMEQQEEELQRERVRLATARAALLQERQQARISKEQRRAVDQANAALAQAQHAQKRYLQEAYCNIPEEHYFSQFNTSSR
ncbi:RIB43A-like with coiled-coils protein 2 [Electrophorus electricus]|uniref:RIB43A domain with coiled-coils 2 n=1 Tax=Electrophorus electricus TaxID=8005 RepID=A0A4W4H0F8_ELEEL|nr:RIB43A-like with coiled-coils protein 2 [Electrophorus electricus]